jgi:hypothetical protein
VQSQAALGKVERLAVLTTLLSYCQLVLGSQLRHLSAGAQPERERPDITISVETVPPEHCGLGHFDLGKLQFSGDVSKLSEDFRDYLRRRAIRVVTGKPFRTLPLVNLDRLKRQMKHIIHE